MPKLGTPLVTLVKLCSILTVAVILPFSIGAVPTQAKAPSGSSEPSHNPLHRPHHRRRHLDISLILHLSSPVANFDRAQSLWSWSSPRSRSPSCPNLPARLLILFRRS